ncbi:chromosomal replication initiator protein DnaA, partial [Patescibacteria group bacterium]|nr:chromosomal replication initiator protein DnaA [Patescibacteria group bacterium]
EKPKKRRPTFQEVIEAVSRYYSVSVNDMIGPIRKHEILIPRQISMILGKKHLNLSYVSIGEVFSGRDHTTVMNAVSKIEDKMQNDHNLLREVHALEKELGLV